MPWRSWRLGGSNQLCIWSVTLLLLLTACQAVSPPPSAVPSTPLADLPIAVARTVQLPTPVPAEIISAADAEYLLLTNLYERVAPSVVNIDVTVESPASAFLSERYSGSGFVYDDDGHIVTNAHVISDAESILVTFNGGYVADAELVGLDPYSDLAVIRVDVDESHLHPVTFGESDEVRVGQRAVAIGNPFGLASSMSVGIVSGLGRQLPSAEMLAAAGEISGGFQNPAIIQVDAPINPGNSGGPLLNSAGEVIGVNTAIRSETGIFEGVGFAVPSSTALRVIPDLLDDGRVEYSWMGITSASSGNGYGVSGLAEALHLPVSEGILIGDVLPNSPAELAGLHGGSRPTIVRGQTICAGGDIIIAVNGVDVSTMDDLVAYLTVNTRPNDSVSLRIVRGDQTFDVPVQLAARPESVGATGSCGT
jgi:S1-C subfamily serine protease